MIQTIHFVDHFGVVDADLVKIVDQFALERILVLILQVRILVEFLILAANRGHHLVLWQRDRDGRTASGRIEPVQQMMVWFDQTVGIQ